METTETIECRECGWITDISVLSETNPNHCPKCGGQLYIAGTEERYPSEVNE
jgi:uncharacterized paraquat-inducible protein A